MMSITLAIRERAEKEGGFAVLAKKVEELDPQKKGIDRRKLKKMAEGDGFTISPQELIVLDHYLSPFGLGLGERPLFIRRPLLESFIRSEGVDLCVASFPEVEAERNAVSLWDIKAFNRLQNELQSRRRDLRLQLKDIFLGQHTPLDNDFKKLLDDPKVNLICIGSPRANPLAEFILKKVFEGTPTTQLPFGFWWENESRTQKSRFTVPTRQALEMFRSLGIDNETRRKRSAIILQGRSNAELLLVEPKNVGPWKDYGLFIVHRQKNGKLLALLAGLSGPATFAAAEWLSETAISLPAPSVPNASLIITLECTIEEIKDSLGDRRRIIGQRLYGEPVSF
jgi:hypothetical protein